METIILENESFYSYKNILLSKGDLKTYIPLPGDLVRVIVPSSIYVRNYMICVFPNIYNPKEKDVEGTEFFNIANIDLAGNYNPICFYQKDQYIIPATKEDKEEFQKKLLKVGKFYNEHTKEVLDLPEEGDIITLGGIDSYKIIGVFKNFDSDFEGINLLSAYNVNYNSLTLYPIGSYLIDNLKLSTELERREFMKALMNNLK